MLIIIVMMFKYIGEMVGSNGCPCVDCVVPIFMVQHTTYTRSMVSSGVGLAISFNSFIF